VIGAGGYSALESRKTSTSYLCIEVFLIYGKNLNLRFGDQSLEQQMFLDSLASVVCSVDADG
jgi:hypothetical protein